MSQSRDLGQLRQMLDISFDEEELRTIAFDLQVDYDALPGRGKAAKTRELVALLQRSGRVPELVEISAQLRPHFDWMDQSAAATLAPDTRTRRRRLLWGAALAGAVLLLGVAAFFLQRRSSALPPSDGMVLVNAESYPSRPANTAGVGSFWMDRYEVTNAQYAAYDDTYAYPKGEESHPARGLTWDAAKDYCQSQDKRLPTEAEWELAARGPYGWLYPWGDDAEAVELPADNTYPVGGVPVNRSFFGLFDMAGNVAEWVDNPFTPVSNGQRVSRGSAFNQLRNLSVPIPGDPSAAIMIANTGFRCAASKAQVTPPSRLADVKEPHGIGVDDFKAEDAGWPNNPADTEYGYHPSDFYHLTAVAKSIPEKQFFADNDYDNFILEADLFVDLDVADPDGNYRYGLAFRHDDGRYYAFVIAVRDQSWAVLKFLGEGAPVTLASGQSEAIDGVGHTIGETMDRLTVIANGTAMSFLIDGQIVQHLSDPDIGGGQVGFYTESLDGTEGHIHFDSISVQVLEPSPDRAVMSVAESAAAEPSAPEPTGETVPTTAPAVTTAPEPTAEATSTTVPTNPPAQVEATPSPTPPAAPVASSLGMVFIISGTYEIGEGDAIEMPAFWLDQYETTNAAYAEYVAATGATPPTDWPGDVVPADREQYPVQGVTWEAANSYCQWANKRLPTEAEWEVAARGPRGWNFPWGDVRSDVKLPTDGTYAVGSYPANHSHFGAFDMVGNVWEWVAQPYNTVRAGEQIMRGGDFSQLRDGVEPLAVDPNAANIIRNTGFRCAADQVVVAEDPGIIQYTFEDFEADAERGWRQGSETVESYFIGYHLTDFYHVDIGRPNDCLTVFNDAVFANFMVESDNYIKRTDETGDFRYGLALAETSDAFYALLISPREKTWYVVKNTPAGMALLAEGSEPTLNGFSEETADRLFVIVNGAELTFFVNGRYASRIYEDSYTIKEVGFIVQTLDEIHVHSHYDALTIWQLPDSVPPPEDETPTASINPNFSPPCQGSYPLGKDLVHYRTHLVQPGETLSQLAEDFGVSQQAILDANNITDPNLIQVGETFIIPLPEE